MTKKKQGFLAQMLSSEGKISSKRFVTFICLFFMIVGYIANLFWDFAVADNMFESLQWIVMAGLGFTASENFAPGKNSSGTIGLAGHTDEEEATE